VKFTYTVFCLQFLFNTQVALICIACNIRNHCNNGEEYAVVVQLFVSAAEKMERWKQKLSQLRKKKR